MLSEREGHCRESIEIPDLRVGYHGKCWPRSWGVKPGPSAFTFSRIRVQSTPGNPLCLLTKRHASGFLPGAYAHTWPSFLEFLVVENSPLSNKDIRWIRRGSVALTGMSTLKPQVQCPTHSDFPYFSHLSGARSPSIKKNIAYRRSSRKCWKNPGALFNELQEDSWNKAESIHGNF